jgi:uncharacterized protein YkwD
MGSKSKVKILSMMKRLLPSLCLLLLLPVAFGGQRPKQEKAKPFIKPEVSGIEDRLVELINLERQEHNLSLLKLSPELQAVAEAHSQDMAEQNQVTHSSSDGSSYADRLAAEHILYREAGENVGFSETFVAGLIHQSFMESPDHRQTILEADYDYIGIGIIHKENKGYYITQDFIRSHGIGFLKRTRKDEVDQPAQEAVASWVQKIKLEAQAEIQQLRKENSLDPFVFLKEVDEHAEKVSSCMAKGIPLPPLPEELQHLQTLLVFITASDLESARPKFDIFKNPFYNRGGLGVGFGENREFPSGAVFITLLLFVEKKSSTMTAEQFHEILLEKINLQRSRNGIGKLRVDTTLSQEAASISNNMIAAKIPRITAHLA